MFYLILWIALIALTLMVSFAALFWAMKNNQFDDQERAAYFPLAELPEETAPPRPVRRIAELYILSLGGITVVGALVLAIWMGISI